MTAIDMVGEPQAATRGRWRAAARAQPHILSRTAWLGLALVPGMLTIYFAFRSGGYFPGPQGFIAAELALVLAARFLLAKNPAPKPNAAWLVAVASLVGLAGWALLSAERSDAAGRAHVEATLILLYLLGMALFGTMSRPMDALRWVVRGLALAGVVVCSASLITLTLPATFPTELDVVHPDRLSYPLSYWNSLGLLAGLSLIYCGWLSTSTAERPWARALGAAAVPLLVVTLYYTFSRGATGVTLMGLAIYAILARPRGLPGALIATAAPVLVALMRVHPGGPLVYGDRGSPQVQAIGRETAIVIVGCMAAAGLIRLLTLPIDRRLDRIAIGARLRRVILVGGAAIILAVGTGAAVALDVPDQVQDKVQQFLQDDRVAASGGGSRFFDAGANGRIEQWNSALDAFHTEPWNGIGAGVFPLYWERNRESSLELQNVHSLYLETLAELGIPGLALIVVILLLLLWAFAVRVRRLDRCLSACLTAAMLSWAVRAAVDWDWEIPAITFGLFAAGGLALAAGKETAGSAWRWPARAGVVLGAIALAIVPGLVGVSEARMMEARVAVERDDWPTAIRAAERAAATDDSQAAPHYLLGFSYLSEDQPRRAGAAMREAVRRDPENSQYWIGLAVAEAQMGKSGRRSALMGYRLDPRNKQAAAAQILARQGRRSLADASIAMP